LVNIGTNFVGGINYPKHVFWWTLINFSWFEGIMGSPKYLKMMKSLPLSHISFIILSLILKELANTVFSPYWALYAYYWRFGDYFGPIHPKILKICHVGVNVILLALGLLGNGLRSNSKIFHHNTFFTQSNVIHIYSHICTQRLHAVIVTHVFYPMYSVVL